MNDATPSPGNTDFPALFRLLHAVERLNRRFSRDPPQVLYAPGTFNWTAPLERHWRGIRAELERVLGNGEAVPAFQEISPEAGTLTRDGRWQTYVLYAYGHRAARNCRACPLTAALCEAIPGMKTAFFSILAPGKQIPPHRGPYNGLLRCHLGLIVPQPTASQSGCRMRVGPHRFGWTEGGTVVFDDTYEHEVHNDTDGMRVVLFLDVLRPMRFPLDRLNAGLIRLVAASPYGRRCIRRFNAWYERHGIAADA